MRFPRAGSSLAILVPLALAAAAAGVSADCPQSWLQVGAARSYSAAPARDSMRVVCDYYGDCTNSRAAYDRIHGSSLAQALPGMADLGTDDEFHLVGPASGTPIDFSAQLQVSAYGTAEDDEFGYPGLATVDAHFSDGSASQVASGAAAPGEPLGLLQTLELPQSRLSGELFHLTLQMGASAMGLGRCSISAQLSFTGLPPGYAVVSCTGLVSDPTVATPPSSWGRLKAIYRGR